MKESAIREGFQTLKDGRECDNLYQSALCRAKADWLVGINATRLFSVLYARPSWPPFVFCFISILLLLLLFYGVLVELHTRAASFAQ